MGKLKLHLQLAIKFVKLNAIPIKEVTQISTICDVFYHQLAFKSFITKVHKLLKLYLTIAVTTASAERNFSALKHAKFYDSVTIKSLYAPAHLQGNLNLQNISEV